MIEMTPEALQKAHDKIDIIKANLLSFEGAAPEDEDDTSGLLSPMAEQHFFMALDLINAGLRALKLARVHLMQNR